MTSGLVFQPYPISRVYLSDGTYVETNADGTAAPTEGGEAFLDANAIAGQGSKVYDVSGFGAQVPASPCRIRIEGAAHGVNYGFDRVRFVHPVRSGSRLRGHFKLLAATQRSEREWQLTYDVSVEIEGARKPALAAIWLTMQVMG